MHTPLFLSEIIALLKEKEVKTVLDATFAEGGHGLNLAKLGFNVLGIEWDPEMFIVGQTKIKDSGLKNITLIQGNYRNVRELALKAGFRHVQAVVFDLGLSMYQLNFSHKGFSLKRGDTLDLRIGGDLNQSASDWLNKVPDAELNDSLGRLIEDRQSGAIVRRILAFRRQRSLSTVSDLEAIISSMNQSTKETNKLLRLTLQALRIIVNEEFTNIQLGFEGALELLEAGGLLIYLTYHSLEDRLVKRLSQSQINSLQEIGKVKQNREYPFAKSAKLRVYEKQTT